MEVNETLERKLWTVSRDNPLDKNACDLTIDYLLARLSAYIQQPLELTGENWLDGDAFSADFRGAIAPRNAFNITYAGILGMETIGEERAPHVSASLFLFGNHHRLAAGQQNRSFIELVYERRENNAGYWRSLSWQIDEFDEFEYVNDLYKTS